MESSKPKIKKKFSQVNSEHCRHKTFNASFILDGQPQNKDAVRDDQEHLHEESVRGALGLL